MTGRKMRYIEDATWARFDKAGGVAKLFYISRDWLSLRPWTYNNEPVGYVAIRRHTSPGGKMVVAFVGPFAFAHFRTHRDAQEVKP